VHGKFRMREGGTAFPDTYWFSPRELKDRGFCVADLRAAVEIFEESMAMAREEAMAELTEEESEEEGEGEERGQRGVEEGGGGRVPEAGVNAEAEQEAQEDAPGEDEEGGGYGLGTHVAAGADG
tara:strand:+ start:575 stop:946 length:372 start_codon:yes stop_codon:yes gene_type:complete